MGIFDTFLEIIGNKKEEVKPEPSTFEKILDVFTDSIEKASKLQGQRIEKISKNKGKYQKLPDRQLKEMYMNHKQGKRKLPNEDFASLCLVLKERGYSKNK